MAEGSHRMIGEEALSDLERHRVRALKRRLADERGVPVRDVRVVRSPYRACPLGAHVDHQLGDVTGMALDRALLLAFAARADRSVALRSLQFDRPVEFRLDELPEQPVGDWADYARGAVYALRQQGELRRGMCALIDGYDKVGGLSSSAAVGVAYLMALETANRLDCDAETNIELDRIIENDYIGLNNGILDQSTILLSRRRNLMHLDCSTGRSELIPLGSEDAFVVAVLFSGLRKPLAETGYNRRVAECEQAAAHLLEAAGMTLPDSIHLRHVPEEVYDLYRDALPPKLRRRAEHFFGEQRRVRRGVELWRRGDLEGFGGLINQSGRSSVEKYECGNPYLRTAYEALSNCDGVYGARFSGAGFRGCCIGLAAPDAREHIAETVLTGYLKEHPDMDGEAEVYFCSSADGAALLE